MKAFELFTLLIRDGMPQERATEFMQVHVKQPWIWGAFCKAVSEELKENPEHISAKSAWERMRKNAKRDTGMEYALNNNLHSLYARAWTAKQRAANPLFFRDVFEFRCLTKAA